MNRMTNLLNPEVPPPAQSPVSLIVSRLKVEAALHQIGACPRVCGESLLMIEASDFFLHVSVSEVSLHDFVVTIQAYLGNTADQTDAVLCYLETFEAGSEIATEVLPDGLVRVRWQKALGFDAFSEPFAVGLKKIMDAVEKLLPTLREVFFLPPAPERLHEWGTEEN